jgi:replicative DNA helicase
MNDFNKNTNDRRSSITNPTPYAGLGKLPPQATDLEEAVLGALMIGENALFSVIDILKPDSFYRDNHKKIYNAILALFQAGNPVDILTVIAQLRTVGELEMIGGAYYITQLTESVASSANIEYHARIVQQKFLSRELIRISTEAVNAAYEDTTDILELIDRTQTQTYAMVSNVGGKEIKQIDKLVKSRIEEYKKPVIAGLTGVGSNFSNIDSITGGWQKTDLIIIAARPAMGKTAFAMQVAKNAAIHHDTPVAIFSLE